MQLLDKTKFDKLRAPAKRVAICKDVIARIDGEKIKETHGALFLNRYDIMRAKGSPQEILNTKKCEVCAKGALVCSWVGNFNSYNRADLSVFSEELGRERYPQELLDIFGREMLDNIEAAFEGQAYYWHYNDGDNGTLPYARAFSKYNLRDIMQYIVDNKGKFPLPVA